MNTLKICFISDSRVQLQFSAFLILIVIPRSSAATGTRHGLDDAENALGVGAVELLLAAGSLDRKGGGNLPPPFGKLRITAVHILVVTLWIDRIGQGGNDIHDDKPPLIIVNRAAYFAFLEQCNAVFWIVVCTLKSLLPFGLLWQSAAADRSHFR